jgi:hypothetical protein
MGLFFQALLGLLVCKFRLAHRGDMSWLNSKVSFERNKQNEQTDRTELIQTGLHETSEFRKEIERVRISIAAAARVLPFKSQCLPRSIVMANLLSKRGYKAIVKIGVRKQDQQMLSHAWVELDDVIVCEPELVASEFSAMQR